MYQAVPGTMCRLHRPASGMTVPTIGPLLSSGSSRLTNCMVMQASRPGTRREARRCWKLWPRRALRGKRQHSAWQRWDPASDVCMVSAASALWKSKQDTRTVGALGRLAQRCCCCTLPRPALAAIRAAGLQLSQGIHRATCCCRALGSGLAMHAGVQRQEACCQGGCSQGAGPAVDGSAHLCALAGSCCSCAVASQACCGPPAPGTRCAAWLGDCRWCLDGAAADTESHLATLCACRSARAE